VPRRSASSRLARALLSRRLRERADAIREARGGEYDSFGAAPGGAELGLASTRFLYETYFRVASEGIERVPASGPVIVAANHSGSLPLDAFMLCADLLRNTEPPRPPRAVIDRFVPRLPFVGTFFARVGAIDGARRNVELALERGELVVVFPEGTPGIGKPFSERYRLQPWRVGHVELALTARAPIVPVAIVGAEEQMPTLARLDVRPFGAPYLPILATPIPLPVKYRIRYGAPVALHEQLDGDPRDPALLAAGAARIKARVQTMIDEMLRERPGVFR